MKTLAQREAERRAFLETLKPQMVKILDEAVPDSRELNHAELEAEIAADLADDRRTHRRKRLSHA
ncbi:MAG TPA: hypothetical protein VMD91_16510 [Candidatus Sulfotelmatobacter sp.]|nr:hypothetical protein [Candidatus Sulfotelmatobacter sp.]